MTTQSNQTIAADKVVSFHYTLRNGAGEVLDSTDPNDPLPYLHGAENIVPGLEREMLGHTVGDRFQAVIPPEEGYGQKVGPGPQPLPRNAFPEELEIAAGMQFDAEDEQGNPVSLWVTNVTDQQVFVDVNHPLAGETLHFEVEIVEVRDATEEELAHGHPHGMDDDEDEDGGHHCSSCGCCG